jgi:general secretion pathway protein N
MSGRKTRRRPSLLLIALCLALGYHVWRVLEAGPVAIDAGAAPPPPAPIVVAPRETIAELPRIDEFAETVARPLFMATRRPPEPEEEVVEEAKTGAQRNLFNLLGIVISSDERVALVTRRRGGEMLRLVVGQYIDGWRVETIRSDRMTLSQGDETEVLKLTDAQRPKRRKKRAAKQQQEPAATEEAAEEETENEDESQ